MHPTTLLFRKSALRSTRWQPKIRLQDDRAYICADAFHGDAGLVRQLLTVQKWQVALR